MYSSIKKKIRKVRLICDIENWLWKSEFCYIWPSIPNQTKYIPKTFLSPFSKTFGLVYSRWNSATLICSSEVTLMHNTILNTIGSTIFWSYFCNVYFVASKNQVPNCFISISCCCCNSKTEEARLSLLFSNCDTIKYQNK